MTNQPPPTHQSHARLATGAQHAMREPVQETTPGAQLPPMAKEPPPPPPSPLANVPLGAPIARELDRMLAAQNTAIQRVRDLHAPVARRTTPTGALSETGTPTDYCTGCMKTTNGVPVRWPCSTIRALDHTGSQT